jgi:hypothetical protein
MNITPARPLQPARRHSPPSLLVTGFFLLIAGLITVSMPARAIADGLGEIRIEVAAGEHSRHETPIAVAIELPADALTLHTVKLVPENGPTVIGQITRPGLLHQSSESTAGNQLRELHFVLPQLEAGETIEYRLEAADHTGETGFQWKDHEGVFSELQFGNRPVVRYMHQSLDESTPEDRFLTYKVFHHLFDPTGDYLLTNGPDGQNPYEFDNILFPHHRGIFYGFNRCSYGDGVQADVWHCRGDDHQRHADLLQQDVGPIVGRHRVAIGWHGKEKQEFAREHRELAAYNVSEGHLIEFSSRLESQVGPLMLAGDPQHAGFQFRAHNEVAADTKGDTFYVRVDGTGKPGETRNWPQDSSEANLPWKGLSFVRAGQRYTVAYLDLPTNPKESRFSERDYARFGSYFEYELDEDRPLEVRYRLRVKLGEMTPEEIAAHHRDFADPPHVRVIRNN